MGTDTSRTSTDRPQTDLPISPQAQAVADLVALNAHPLLGGHGTALWVLQQATRVRAVADPTDFLAPVFDPSREFASALNAVSAIVPDANALAVVIQAGQGKPEVARQLKSLTKQSISIPEVTWNAVEALAEAEGISRSAWMARAAEQVATQQVRLGLALRAAEEMAAEYEAEHGPISVEAVAEARRALGLGDEDEEDQAA